MRPDKVRRYTQFRRILDAYQVFLGCALCGWREHPAALDFHHRDPTTKYASLNAMYAHSWGRIWAEVAKCDVLCCRCHRLVEAGVLKLENSHHEAPRTC